MTRGGRVELRVDIGIKCDDAKEKIGRVAAYRGEPDGFKAHIDNADAKWRIVEAVERNPATVSEAEASLKSATDAENAIAKELHWLSTNKTARDGAKAIEAEIAREIDPELKRFKADDYARNLFRDGDSRRRDGNAALANGDFPAAKKKLDEARAKLSEAAANAKKFCIDTHLNTAKKWLAASRWQQCVEECDTVLDWDSANADARKIKAEAEGHLVPTAKVVAMIDGREVFGAKVNDGKQIHTTPINWTLRQGNTYGPYNVIYESGGKRYIGTFASMNVNWRGPKTIPVHLKEYTGVLFKAGHKGVKLWEGGPYWAETNIGAEKPEDYGYYFWWGDTVGYKWENGAWVASNGSKSAFSFRGDNAPTYGKSKEELSDEKWITTEGVLAPKHDAANVQWGGGWRMPTKQELDDLDSKCDWEWTPLNGVEGYRIRGRGTYASVSIFLPCAGYGYGTSLYSSGSYGYYGSSVPDSDYYFNARGLLFYSSYHYTYGSYRYYGFAVRPVQGFAK